MDFVKVIKERKRIMKRYCEWPCPSDCPFFNPNDDNDDCLESLLTEDPEEYEEIIEEWSKKNPKITNQQKVTELIKANFDCVNNDIFVGDTGIVMSPEFANKEYVPPKKDN